jgi:hypothetical protein
VILKTSNNGYIVAYLHGEEIIRGGHLDGREIIRVAPLPANDSAKLYKFLFGAVTQRVKVLAEKRKGAKVIPLRKKGDVYEIYEANAI